MRKLHLVWLTLSVVLAACGKSTANAPGALPQAGGAAGESNAAGMPDRGVIADAGYGAGGPVTLAGASAGGAGGEGGLAGAAGLAGSGACLKLSCLAGAEFVYVPTRTWQSSATPGGSADNVMLAEADYSPLLGPRYNVKFSSDALQVELTPSTGGDTVKGTRKTPPLDEARFELTLFAGGRFDVQVGQSAFQAEYTVYGSGVPILSSTRGELQSR